MLKRDTGVVCCMQVKEMNKKGVEMSLQVVIVAVIILLVAFVLIAIFSGKMGESVETTEGLFKGAKCEELAGENEDCTAKMACGPDERQRIGNYEEKTKNELCCCTLPKSK